MLGHEDNMLLCRVEGVCSTAGAGPAVLDPSGSTPL